MPQCNFIRKGYVVDSENLEIYSMYRCEKPVGHGGRHIYFRSPNKFHKKYRNAVLEKEKIIKARTLILDVLNKNEAKRNQ